MKIAKTIEDIDRELTRITEEYEHWFQRSPEQLHFKPRTGWSTEQILEHVTLTNRFLLILIRKGASKAKERALKVDLAQAVADYEYNLQALDEIAKHKSFIWIRPEHMEPTGEKSVNEIKALLQEQMDECRDILRRLPNGEGILYKTTMSVNSLGKIDVYQYIYFLCQHAARHIVQMQVVRDEFQSFIKGS